VSPQVTVPRIQIWRARRPWSGSSSTYLSNMIGVNENISHSTAMMCRNTVIHSYICNSQMFPDICRYGHFFMFWYVELVLTVCLRLSVTLCIKFFTFKEKYDVFIFCVHSQWPSDCLIAMFRRLFTAALCRKITIYNSFV
jgi:hypothetical protein